MASDFVRSGQPIKAQWANDVSSALRRFRNPRKPKRTAVSGGGSKTACPFGRVKLVDGDPVIPSALVYAGDKNFTVPDFVIDVSSTSTRLLYFEIPVEVNRDDANEIILPQIKTSSWTPAYESTTSDSYPDNIAPDVSTGLGTIIIPIARIITTGTSLSSFEATGCGNIFVEQCGGTLSFSRV